jgi:hypothetical protein
MTLVEPEHDLLLSAKKLHGVWSDRNDIEAFNRIAHPPRAAV